MSAAISRKGRELLREIIPLTRDDCFTVFKRKKAGFDFPLHYHDELELNLVLEAKGALRVVGDHEAEIKSLELVLVGPNLPHGWFNHRCRQQAITEVTVQFHRDLFDHRFPNRNPLSSIRDMFLSANQGILFSEDTSVSIKDRLLQLTDKEGFQSMMELMGILHELSLSRDRVLLNARPEARVTTRHTYDGLRIEQVMQYLYQHYATEVSLGEAAELVAMSEVAFSRFFRQKTGQTFMDTVHEIRLRHASRMLIDTEIPVKEVAFQCGFNNLSHFNRLFLRKKHCTPLAFRANYTATGTRTFV
jgi:AraC-like DNA-binding protein